MLNMALDMFCEAKYPFGEVFPCTGRYFPCTLEKISVFSADILLKGAFS